MDSNVIAEAMKRFVQDDGTDCGLMIADLPTGIGKTYQACRMMLEASTEDPGRKFIFITDQIKNLPVDTLNGLRGEFPKPRCIVIKSNAEAIMSPVLDEERSRIANFFRSSEEDTKVLEALYGARAAYKRSQGSGDPQYREWTQERLEECEREFRSAVKRVLKREFESDDERRLCILANPDYRWISKLYPAVHFEYANIVLMTDKKFLRRIDTIVGESYSIWAESDYRRGRESPEGRPSRGSSQLIDHTIVIDEFDVFKRVITDSLVEENRNSIDAIRAFRFIRARLEQWPSLPARMMTPSKWWSSRRKTTIEDRFRHLLSMANDIQSSYHLEYLMKQFGQDDEGNLQDVPTVSFMFHDCQQFSVGNAVNVTTEQEHRYNRISVSRGGADGYRFNELYGKIDNLFDRLSDLIRDLGMNYRSNLIAEGASGDDERTSLHMCISSVVDVFDMDSELSEFFRYKSMHRGLRFTNGVDYQVAECTYYSRGFSYVCMIDSHESQFQTKLRLTRHDVTPELVLRHMCERTKVIGLSATAGMMSPVCNFSMEYLRDMGVRFHRLNEAEAAGIRAVSDANAVGYRDGTAKIDMEPVDAPGESGPECWEALFGEDGFGLYDAINTTNDGAEVQEFHVRRYLRLAHAFERFLEDDGIRSMICFFPPSLRNNEEALFNATNVNRVLDCFERRLGIRIDRWWQGSDHDWRDADCEIVSVESSNADERLGVVKSRLAAGRKVMVVTSYRTLGAGQNLQYPIPHGCDCVWIRDGEPSGCEKDFDAVYLDCPTNIAPLVKFNEPDSLDRYLFFLEDLDASNEISGDDRRQEVKNAFMKCYGDTAARYPRHFKNSQAYNLALAQAIMQAVGRMTRTGWRPRRMLVLYDPAIPESGMFGMDEEMYGSHLGYEFRRMYDKFHAPLSMSSSEIVERARWDAIRRTGWFTEFLRGIRKSMYNGHGESISTWKKVRRFVLEHPTAERFEADGDPYLNRVVRYGYITPPVPASSYYFTQRLDFQNEFSGGVDVSFSPPGPSRDSWYKVCPETANMDLLRRIAPVRAALDDMGAPPDFTPRQHIMCPKMFQGVYMGALGEVAGCAILADRGFFLKELDRRHYERFDFFLGDLYFDFKNWNRTRFDDFSFREEQKGNVAAKLEDCGGRRAYIINIVFEQDREVEPFHVTDLGGGREMCEVPYLYRFVDGRPIANEEFFQKLRGDVGSL